MTTPHFPQAPGGARHEAFDAAMTSMPLVAILRGITPEEAPAIGEALWSSGWRILEVPLNSPQPLKSIALLRAALPEALIGAGTVLSAGEVQAVHAAGGQCVVAPHFDPQVVAEALRLGMACLPGVMTPSEAFAALRLGAHALKLFPAEIISPAAVKALRAVLPASTRMLPVGGIDEHNLPAYRQAGASGAGIGSSLYRPGRSGADVAVRARAFVQAWTGTIAA